MRQADKLSQLRGRCLRRASRRPPRDVRLETADAMYFPFKSDIFNRLVTLFDRPEYGCEPR